MWNRRYYYREKIKKAACWALIIILLPYIVTVFVNGPKIVTASKVDEMTIDVKGDRKSTRLNSSHSAKSRMPSSA